MEIQGTTSHRADGDNRQQLEALMRSREIRRDRSDTAETVEYDTGQVITRTLVQEENSDLVKRHTGQDSSPYVEERTEDTRSGSLRTRGARSGIGNFAGRKEGYPELQPFLDEIYEASKSSHLKVHEPAIMGFLPTLMGHGNMHPAALMHPRVILGYVVGTIFPVEREHAFKLSKLRKHFQANKKLLNPAGVNESYDGYVACIGPDDILAMGDPSNKPGALEIRVFNPKKLAETEKSTERDIYPTKENTLFEIHFFFNNNQTPPLTSLSTLPYNREMFNAIHRMDLAQIESEREGGMYIKVDERFMEVLEKLAPLPLEASDCGRELGYPEVNEEFHLRCQSSYETQRNLLSALREDAQDAVEILNGSDRWKTVSDLDSFLASDERRPGALYVSRETARESDNGWEWETVTEVFEIPPDQTDKFRRLIELSDSDKRDVGIKEAFNKVFIFHGS